MERQRKEEKNTNCTIGRIGVKEVVPQNIKGNRLMTVRLVYWECVINVISIYTLQSEATGEEKEEFWRKLETGMERSAVGESLQGAEFNGHLGAENERIKRIHGGHGFENVNEDGKRMLDLASSFDLATASTYFCKREEHLITYKTGGNVTYRLPLVAKNKFNRSKKLQSDTRKSCSYKTPVVSDEYVAEKTKKRKGKI